MEWVDFSSERPRAPSIIDVQFWDQSSGRLKQFLDVVFNEAGYVMIPVGWRQTRKWKKAQGFWRYTYQPKAA